MGKIEKTLSQGRPQPIASNTSTARSSDLSHIVRLVSRFLAGQRRVVVMAVIMLIAEAGTAVFEAYPLAYLIDFLHGSRPDLDSVPESSFPYTPTAAVLP